MKIKCLILSGAVLALLSGCDNTSGGSGYVAGSCNALASSFSTSPTVHLMSGQVPVTVGGNYINEITVSVTICEHGTTNCQTIPDVLLDTGSNGLRLFHCTTSLSLPNVTAPDGGMLAECVTYADTTSQWGSVVTADVTLGTHTASNVPIQIIDQNFAAVPGDCTNLETDPSLSGYNGIIGVGLLANDCPYCVTHSQNYEYYSCSGSTCNLSAAPTASQVTNPVSMMSADNNGVIITLPAVPSAGATTASGTLTLGINTNSGNIPNGNVVAFPANSSLNFQTVFDSSTYTTAFIDSGSNALYMPPDASLPQCEIQGFTFFCPNSVTTLTAVQKGTSGSPTSPSISFYVNNASNDLSTSNPNLVFSDYAGLNATTDQNGNIIGYSFDWGLPFFLGRSIFVGINGLSAGSLGTGPFWAYDTTVNPPAD